MKRKLEMSQVKETTQNAGNSAFTPICTRMNQTLFPQNRQHRREYSHSRLKV